MMNTHWSMTLAFDWGGVIGIAVVLLITFGSGVASWLKKQAEAREAARRQERGLMSPHTLEPEADESPRRAASVGDAAAQRREQLRELARQRAQMAAPGSSGVSARGGGAGGGSGAPIQPRNLTMAERIARARAQEEYARRAQSLQAQAERARQEARAQQIQQEALRRQQAARDKAQRAAAAKQQAVRRQRASAQQQQQQAPVRRRPSQTQRPAAPVRQVGRAAAGAAVPRPSTTPQRRAGSRPPRQATAHAAARPAESALAAASSALDPTNLSRQSLRNAFVLKELLDRPVGMREPGQHGLL